MRPPRRTSRGHLGAGGGTAARLPDRPSSPRRVGAPAKHGVGNTAAGMASGTVYLAGAPLESGKLIPDHSMTGFCRDARARAELKFHY